MTMVVGMPARFEAATWEQLPENALKRITRTYLEHYATVAPRGIAPTFIGKARTWKTHAAAVIALAVADRGGVDTQFVVVPEIMVTLEAQRFSTQAAAWIQRWKTVPFLVMDDFAEVLPQSFGATILVAVSAARFNAKLPTLWTGNLTMTTGIELADRYGPMFARRLLDGSQDYRAVIT